MMKIVIIYQILYRSNRFHTNENIDNGLELEFSSLQFLNCYHCEKCGILEYYIEEDITMRCQDCLYI